MKCNKKSMKVFKKEMKKNASKLKKVMDFAVPTAAFGGALGAGVSYKKSLDTEKGLKKNFISDFQNMTDIARDIGKNELKARKLLEQNQMLKQRQEKLNKMIMLNAMADMETRKGRGQSYEQQAATLKNILKKIESKN